MGNIDEKTISGLLARLDTIKEELSELEEAIRELATQAPEPVGEPIAEETVPGTPAVEESAVEEPVVEGPVIEGPAAEEPMAEVPADEPFDITISDIDMPIPPVVEPAEEPVPDAIAPEEETIAADIIDDIPEFVPAPEHRPQPVEGPAEGRKAILDTAKADTAVMDVMAEKQAWRTDRPGMPVKNIISAISLNDRVLLINVLFGEDPMLFQETIAKFNAMGSLKEALDYISEHHPDWDLGSEPVYRLMMAVRRKLS